MPSISHLWVIGLAVALFAIVVWMYFVGKKLTDPRYEIAAYLALMSLGLFSYYVNRSHWQVFLLVSWPFVILAFYAVDSFIAWRDSRFLSLFVGVVTALSGFLTIANKMPEAVQVARVRLAQYEGRVPPGDVQNEIAFIKRRVKNPDKTMIFAEYQTELYGDIGFKLAHPEMSWVETLRDVDADKQISQFLLADSLYIGYPFVTEWFSKGFEKIKKAFALVEWNPNGRLIRLERRNQENDKVDLFKISENLTTNSLWGRSTSFPFDPHLVLGSNFDVRLRFDIERNQLAHATIITNSDAAFKGFTVEIDESSMATLYGGMGNHWQAKSMPLIADQPNELRLTCDNDMLKMELNGYLSDGKGDRLTPSSGPVIVGDWQGAGRELRGRLLSFSADLAPRGATLPISK